MNSSGPLPLALRLVALLFLWNGLISIATTVVALTQSQMRPDFEMIDIFVCLGLLRLSSGWRTCALVLTYINIVMYPVVAFWSASAAPAHVVLYGLFPVPSFIGTINAVLLFGVTLWQWSILKRPDVKALFIQKKISGF